jgi:hypothetical protein
VNIVEGSIVLIEARFINEVIEIKWSIERVVLEHLQLMKSSETSFNRSFLNYEIFGTVLSTLSGREGAAGRDNKTADLKTAGHDFFNNRGGGGC